MRAQGVIEFVPAVDGHYALHGTVAPDASSIWLEDEATHQHVGNTISVTGKSAPGYVEPPARPQINGA